MEADMTVDIKYDNKVAEHAVELFKGVLRNGNYDEGRKRKISEELCEELDNRTERDGFSIELDCFCIGIYESFDTWKSILTNLAKALPEETFRCHVVISTTQEDTKIESSYDGKNLEFYYQYKELGWDELYCEECDYSGEIEEYHEDGVYKCPKCGNDIQKYERKKDGHFVIRI